MLTLVQIFALVLSSIATIALSYYKISITTYQQILIVLMVLALILYNLYNSRKPNEPGSSSSKKLPPFLVTPFILFISSFFVQLLIISTGAVFSPFLILLHLFTLAASFLLSFKTSLSFVILALFTLGVNVYLNSNQINLIKEDPGTVLLYGVTFLVIIPLAQIVTKKYHIKDELSKILSHQVQVGESILESLSELVIITDPNLKIISVNEAVKKFLNLNDSEIIEHNLFDMFNLKDSDEKQATLETLSIDKVLAEHNTRIVSGFSLFAPNRVAPFKVTIQIRPIIDSSGKIEQLSFVITEGQNINDNKTHEDLDQALNNQKMRLDYLREQLKNLGLSNVNAQVELIDKTEQDILIAEEIEDHSIKELSSMTDVAELTQEIINSKNNLSVNLGVNLKFNMADEDVKEASLLNLRRTTPQNQILPTSDFAIPLDSKWLKVLISKILDLAILLSISTKPAEVEVHLIKGADLSLININIVTSYPLLEGDKDFIFEKYYPNLQAKKILNLSSGLEGYIAKSILNQLNIPLIIRCYTNHTAFIISLAKKVR